MRILSITLLSFLAASAVPPATSAGPNPQNGGVVNLTQDGQVIASAPALPDATQGLILDFITSASPLNANAFTGSIGVGELPADIVAQTDGVNIIVENGLSTGELLTTVYHELLHVYSPGNDQGGVDECQHAAIYFHQYLFMLDVQDFLEEICAEADLCDDCREECEEEGISCATFRYTRNNFFTLKLVCEHYGGNIGDLNSAELITPDNCVE